MRIAMFLAGLRPGSVSWTIYQDFAEAFRARGHEFELLTTGEVPPGGTSRGRTHFLPAPRSGPAIDRLLAPLSRTRRLWSMGRSLTRFLRRHGERFDLLYVEQAYPNGAAVFEARRAGAAGLPLVVTPMGEDILEVPSASYGFGRYPLPRALVRRTLRGAEGVRWISPLAERHAGRWVRGATATVPLSVASRAQSAVRELSSTAAIDGARAAARARIGMSPEGRRAVLSLGRLHPFKGIHYLVDALADLPEADLWIVGPALSVRGFGDYGEFLRERARRRGLQERVHLMGAVPHEATHDWLAAADVLVVPSILESLNKVCVEAAAAGTPFVVTRSTGISDYVPERGVGRVIDPESPAAIADGVRELLAEKGSFRPEVAREFVTRFDPDRVVEELETFFVRIVSGAA